MICKPGRLLLASVIAGLLTAAPAAASGEWQLQVGAAAVVKPKYEGSKSYEVIAVPIIAPVGSGNTGRVQFKGLDDLRFRLIEHGGFEAGPLLGYRFGRDEDDGRRLAGLGDVDGGLIAGGYMAYDFGRLKPFLSYHHQVTGDDAGAVARLGAELAIPISARVAMRATAGITWADEDYMQSFFGVTAAQSAASLAGLARFEAEAGVKDVFIGLTANIELSDRWSLRLGGSYAHLLGDAANSPVTESASQWTGTAGLTWRFSTSR